MKKTSTDRTITRALRSRGAPAAYINSVLAELNDEDTRGEAHREGRNWVRLLKPLRTQIKLMQTSRHRWSRDPLRAEVYGNYHALLLKVRTRLENIQFMNTADNLTIPELARAHNLANNGMRWADWVPNKIRTAFDIAFEKLYSVDIPNARTDPETGAPGHAKGKRIVPFKTQYERSSTEKRWRNLLIDLTLERAGRLVEGSDSPLIGWMDMAIEAIKQRQRDKEAPVKWEHLLPIEEQRKMREWHDTLLTRMTTPDAHAQASVQLNKRIDSLRETQIEKQLLRRAKEAQRQRERRAFAKLDRAGG